MLPGLVCRTAPRNAKPFRVRLWGSLRALTSSSLAVFVCCLNTYRRWRNGLGNDATCCPFSTSSWRPYLKPPSPASAAWEPQYEVGLPCLGIGGVLVADVAHPGALSWESLQLCGNCSCRGLFVGRICPDCSDAAFT